MAKTSYEERQKEKEERRAQHRAAAQKEKNKTILTWAGIIGGSALILFALVYFGGRTPEDMQGERYPSQGEVHIAAGEEPPEPYSTHPPVSGWHYDATLPAGFYEEERAFGNILHSMEHGAAVIYYNPNTITLEELALLRNWYDNHRRNSRLIAVPLGDMDTNYALAAWTWLDKFDEYDEARMDRFISDHLDKWGPERGLPF